MHDRVLIIGNGFDIDLGWNTRYSDFAHSSYWPFQGEYFNPNANLSQNLNRTKDKERWFDLEFALHEYAKKPKENHLAIYNGYENDKEEYDLLVSSLSNYLNDEIRKSIKVKSFAAQVLGAAIKNEKFKIYSFNYTPIDAIAVLLSLNLVSSIDYIHGSLSDNNIILGIDDDVEIKDGYEYMRKSFNPNYGHHDIYYDIQESKEVIFFGLSFGSIDYAYFSQFFKDQSKSDLKRDESKYIRIFTYDEKSRMEIQNNLRTMNGNQNMFVKNDLEFILTRGEGNIDKLSLFIQKMADESNSSDKRTSNY